MINWEEIWKNHSPYFKNGYANVPLKEGVSFRLKPGPGFGDLSHPTTNLILSLLKPIICEKTVVDIGSGSGILSIAAMLLGAKKVYSFEICEEAIEHSLNNFKLNNLRPNLNTPPTYFDLALINMISSEQRVARSQYPFLTSCPHTLLVSGLLTSERNSYLKEMLKWRLISEKTDGEWLALHLELP